MKLDKETLIKQRFWFLLGLFVPLVLIVWIMLITSVSGTVAKEREEVVQSKKAIDSITNPKNEEFVKLLRDKQEKLQKQKDKVWEQAWKNQLGLMTWPPPLDRKYANAYFGDDLTVEDRNNYADAASYPSQFAIFKDQTESARLVQPNLIYPVEYKDGWDKLLTYIGKQDGTVGKWKIVPPTTEECWLAQEEFWVQRDLLQIIRDALANVGKFKQIALDPKDASPAGGGARYRYRNTNWEIDLVLKQQAGKPVITEDSTIKNINPGKRTLLLGGNGARHGVQIQLHQGEQASRVIDIQDFPLAWNKSTRVSDAGSKESIRIDGFNPQQAPEVVQIFDWYTSPIKRVDEVKFGSFAISHRVADRKLMSRQIGPKEEKKEEEAPAAGGGFGGPAGFGSMGGRGPGAEGGPSGAAAAANLTPNGLDRDRYIDVGSQDRSGGDKLFIVRRMPVALVVVLDQEYISDVLTAVTNSYLRIQTTQVHWQHLPAGVVKPPQPTAEEGDPNAASGTSEGGRPASSLPPAIGTGSRPMGIGSMRPPAMGSNPRGGSEGARPKPMGGGTVPMRPGYGAGPGPMSGFGTGGAAGAGPTEEEDDPNLVELAVYGIASLYERYPPKAPAADATAIGGPIKP